MIRYVTILCVLVVFVRHHPQCKGQDKWETTLNEQDLGLLKIVKSLLHKYDEDTEYRYVAYHTLLRRFMLSRQGDYSKLD